MTKQRMIHLCLLYVLTFSVGAVVGCALTAKFFHTALTHSNHLQSEILAESDRAKLYGDRCSQALATVWGKIEAGREEELRRANLEEADAPTTTLP